MPEVIEIVDRRGSTYPENLGRQVSPASSINELELRLLLERHWPNTSEKVFREAVSRAAPVIAREAKRSTLFRDLTGRLRRSVRIQRRKTDAGDFVNIVAGGPLAPHAHFVEFGTRDRYTKHGRAKRHSDRLYGVLRLIDRLGRRTHRKIRLRHKEKIDKQAKFRGRAPERAFLFIAAQRGVGQLSQKVVNYLRQRLAKELGLDTRKVRGTRRR